MSKPMLEVKKGASSSQTVPNLLPCHIPYDGPVEPIQAFWSPSEVKGKAVLILLPSSSRPIKVNIS